METQSEQSFVDILQNEVKSLEGKITTIHEEHSKLKENELSLLNEKRKIDGQLEAVNEALDKNEEEIHSIQEKLDSTLSLLNQYLGKKKQDEQSEKRKEIPEVILNALAEREKHQKHYHRNNFQREYRTPRDSHNSKADFTPREARPTRDSHDSKAGSAPREDSSVRTKHESRDFSDSRARHSHREDNRPRNYRNPKDITCRNGTSCVRRDCIFSHPE